jgi:hypothetical protein
MWKMSRGEAALVMRFNGAMSFAAHDGHIDMIFSAPLFAATTLAFLEVAADLNC